MPSSNILVIGAGPAGIMCAHTLGEAGVPATVVEKEDTAGGLCRTLNFHGYLFDIGGHRFISKSSEVRRIWRDVMGDELLHVKRLSRIFYQKRYFNYPLTCFNTFCNLGAIESGLIILSYLKEKFFRQSYDNTFEDWVTNYFGKRLFNIFFKTYTEKVWGVPCDSLSADWAKERINGLSLRVAIQKAILRNNKGTPKTLIEEFLYPRTGPGAFYNRLKDMCLAAGSDFQFGKTAYSIRHDGSRIVAVQARDRHGAGVYEFPVDYLFSTMPLSALVNSLYPLPPQEVLSAAERLLFRSFIAVNVILEKEHIFPDQWIYIHSPEVSLGRIQNYKNWSAAMLIDQKNTTLGLEYFCDEGDDLWSMNDIDLIRYAMEELERTGIAHRRHLINGFVVRCADAYPVYSLGYAKNVSIVRDYLGRFKNFQTMGRGGLFRYDNSDHALLTGLCAARKFLGQDDVDIWQLNRDGSYLELQ